MRTGSGSWGCRQCRRVRSHGRRLRRTKPLRNVHHEVTAQEHRQLPALDAARYGDRDFSTHISQVPVGGTPTVPWPVHRATGSQLDPRSSRAVTAAADEVHAVAATMHDDRPVAVTRSDDPTARM